MYIYLYIYIYIYVKNYIFLDAQTWLPMSYGKIDPLSSLELQPPK